jgi:hypothetical protein
MSELIYDSDDYCTNSFKIILFLTSLPALIACSLTIFSLYYATIRWDNLLFIALPIMIFGSLAAAGTYVYNLPAKIEIFNDKILKYERDFPNPFHLIPLEIRYNDFEYVVKSKFGLTFMTSKDNIKFNRSSIDLCKKKVFMDMESIMREKRKKVVTKEEFEEIKRRAKGNGRYRRM